MKSAGILKKGVVFALSLMAAFQAEAISLRFKSKIFSSGPDIYACNAGVASAFMQNSICYFGGKPERGFCTPTSCDNAKENCNTDCVCIDKGGMGETYINRILLTAANYTGPHQPDQAGSHVRLAAEGPRFTSVFSSQDSWNRRISNLITHFMTEAYTGSYFVDICYRGTEIPDGGGTFIVSTQASAIPFLVSNVAGYNSRDNDRTGLNFDLASSLGQIYTEKAGLSVERFVVCGQTQATSDFRIDSSTGLPTGPVSGATFWSTAAESQLRASAQERTHGSLIDPKFCKVRYVFRETNWKSSRPNRRNTTGEGAEVCTYTKISDPLTN